MIGGGADSSLWCQIHADVFGRRIRQVKDPIHANVRGAALLASMALGYITIDKISDCVEIKETFEPNPRNKEIYDELFREYKNIYRKTRKIYARLNR